MLSNYWDLFAGGWPSSQEGESFKAGGAAWEVLSVDDFTFDSTDLGETEEFLVDAYTRLRIGGREPNPRTRITRRWLGTTNLDVLDFDFTMDFDVEPLGQICLCRIRSGNLVNRFGGVEDVFMPGDIALLAPPDQSYAGQLHRTHYDVVMFDIAQLNRIAAPADGPATRSVSLLDHRPRKEGGARLSAFVDYLHRYALTDTAVGGSALIADTGAQMLASLVLSAFPNTAQSQPTHSDRHDASTAALQRAVSFIDDNAHLPLSLADIAGYVHMTPRGVQYLFRRHLDCTPMQYLRRVRLDLAHRDLQRANPALDSVAEIAARWGFAHQSRFARYYRQAYGTTPHRTLNQ